jgi:hypothetical protein
LHFEAAQEESFFEWLKMALGFAHSPRLDCFAQRAQRNRTGKLETKRNMAALSLQLSQFSFMGEQLRSRTSRHTSSQKAPGSSVGGSKTRRSFLNL